ncbi:hypothetical protein [Polyangium aurulentum]|uniref:hypothetical protein n=1 Tax=Polyangium aurulentum TaxID=2567896 RepID=UPI0010AE962E|nr:hypothetical protein [Polyangium aurulentum]UQA58761.1 hypothetical protein E8A73_047310 [Polyangium aurulentum]
MNETRPSAPPRAPAVRLVSVTVGDWPPLGCNVELAVAKRRTVLVGKGSTLASTIIQGIAEGARIAVHALSDPDKPRHFRCELETEGGERLSYAYDRRFQQTDEDEPFPPSMRWEERAARPSDNVELWTVRDRRAILGDGTRVSLPPGVGALALAGDPAGPVPEDARRIREFLSGMRYLGAALPRPLPDQRRDVTLTGRSSVLWTSRGLDARLLALASTLVTWYEHDRERYDRVVELSRRIGAPGDLRVTINAESSPRPELEPQHRAQLAFEGVDFGRLPDPVLRRLEILVALVDPATSALLIEEPENAAVPGQVGALLDEVERSAGDRQILVSTYLPQVADWASADERRVIENVRGRVVVKGG